ncbi:MAG: hypothetical protein ABEK42_15290 [Thiohalorhabdaceae bacterium]
MAAGTAFLVAAAATAGESGPTPPPTAEQRPSNQRPEADGPPPPTETFPGPSLSDRPFRPAPSGRPETERAADRDCCDMEH